MPAARSAIDRVLAAVDSAAAELVEFTSALVRVPTVNPPGEAYEECAHLIGARLADCAFDVEYHAAEGRPEHTSIHPRLNVVGHRRGRHDSGAQPTPARTRGQMNTLARRRLARHATSRIGDVTCRRLVRRALMTRCVA